MIYLVILLTDQSDFSNCYNETAEPSTEIIGVTTSLEKARYVAKYARGLYNEGQTIELWKCDEEYNSRERILYYNDDSVSQ